MLYTNHTRHSVIVSIRIESTVDMKKSIQIGIDVESADVGVHDFIVAPGHSLTLAEGTVGEFISARADS